jgi:hypothetical protein
MKNLFFIIVVMLISQNIFSMEIYSHTETWQINENCKLYTTHFWSDNDTPSDPTDDIYLGSDVILDCEDNNIKNELLLNPYFSFLSDEMKAKYGFDKPVYYSDFISFKDNLKEDVKYLKKIKIENNKPPIKTVKVITE